jgi:uroporphyrinogen decarboxylase
MHVSPTQDQLRLARKIVDDAHRHQGLASVDLDRFWADQMVAIADPFFDKCPQLPLGIMMGSECAFVELGEPEDRSRLADDEAYRSALSKRYNDESERIVGKRVLPEADAPSERAWPKVKKLNEIFEAPEAWINGSYWIREAASDESSLAALLDRVERRLEDLKEFILPNDWAEEKAGLVGLGDQVPLYRSQRGPVTFAMSVYGVENLIYLILDNPDLAARFRDLILRTILERARILDTEAGYKPSEAPHGWSWYDDNCAMLNARMYDFFGYPILKAVFDRYCPDAADTRGQHSDSAMGHLLPSLGRLKLTWTNFGPTLTIGMIREHLPSAVIRGQLAPFAFSRNEETSIVAETLRDFEYSREARGVVFETAGSINNGSMLTGMRLIMSTIQNHCRY